jgi:catalase (peroxidase I)
VSANVNVSLWLEAAGIEQQGLDWMSRYGSGMAGETITSGLEVACKTTPVQWSNNFLRTCSAMNGN